MSDPEPTRRVPDVADFDSAIQAHLDRMAALRYADLTTHMILSTEQWPLAKEVAFADGPAYSYSLRLSGFPDGHLAVTLYRDDGPDPLRTEFQRVALSEASTYLVQIAVKEERVTLRLGGQQLGSYEAEQVPLEIRGTPKRN